METVIDEAAAAPDFAEPLEAWRVWRVVTVEGELSLASVVKRTIWPAGEPLVAQCLAARGFLDWARRRPPHPAPGERCACGVYAAPLDRSREYLRDSLPEALARVVGRVSLWGTVVECERGYRASHAYPLSIYVPFSGDGATVARVAEGLGRYGVPVEVLPVTRAGAPALHDAIRRRHRP